HGDDSFTYKANDGSQDSNSATVSVIVRPVNDSPVASGQSIAMNEDTTVMIVLSATDIDSPHLNFGIVSNPTRGSLGALSASNCVANASGAACTATVIYTPAPDRNGPDSFSFRANDGNLDSNVAVVAITINAINEGPVATNDLYTTGKDTTLSVAA